ncbi:beta-glucosidase 22-like protein [Carex littledalei]|uniref:Beta-glucosidase 22-like protein n=1 Tax=Carex littledalei TaxID=544730 RepID=A0A833QQ65_9POAL|nr:beta-glucosidase 22-like protein [Carex littledalei]
MEGARARLFIGVLCCLVVLERAVGLEFTRSDFPSDFVFGSATSAYQERCQTTVLVMWLQTDITNIRYNGIIMLSYRYILEDVKLMADTGLEAYRLSISWSRLIPDGRGEVNPKGVEYYNGLIDDLVKHGIQIHVMIYQLDLPQVLEDEYQGWLSPKIIDDFTAYADVCFKEFGDRVKYWTTLDEPNIIGIGSYDSGLWPPQHCSNPFRVINCTIRNSTVEPYIAVHNLLLAHASVYNLYHTKYHELQGGIVGINVYSFGIYPFSDSNADKEAAQRYHDFSVGWIVNPLTYGDYPLIMKKIVGPRLPVFTKYQSEMLRGAFDFIGLNHYTSLYVMDDSHNTNLGPHDFYADTSTQSSISRNIMPSGQYIPDPSEIVPDPDGLEHMLEYLKATYDNPPLYVQENGLGMTTNSSLEDKKRIDFLSGFIGSTLTAIRNGANVRGYFVWSFIDVFEFLAGYDTTFGLYSVDFESKEKTRKPRLSAHWYSNFLKNNGSISTTGLSDEGYHAEQ